MNDYCIVGPYTARLDTVQIHEDDQSLWQQDVYRLARLVGRAYSVIDILDVGCGSGEKTVALADEFNVHGCDLPAAKPVAGLSFETYDIDSPDPLPLISGGLVIAADVIEHLVHPEKLMLKIRDAAPAVAVLSTPERVLTRGPDDIGPPKNPLHVREWSAREFASFADIFFGRSLVMVMRGRDKWATIVAVVEP